MSLHGRAGEEACNAEVGRSIPGNYPSNLDSSYIVSLEDRVKHLESPASRHLQVRDPGQIRER